MDLHQPLRADLEQLEVYARDLNANNAAATAAESFENAVQCLELQSRLVRPSSRKDGSAAWA
eukprot:343877-Amphidinium_carterae.1